MTDLFDAFGERSDGQCMYIEYGHLNMAHRCRMSHVSCLMLACLSGSGYIGTYCALAIAHASMGSCYRRTGVRNTYDASRYTILTAL
mmetsp:Transcript_8417/g.20192  ORF Transcript_8417/g.20192 Transcript_8417/m.20192 type:complete len:87 (+) Transcript_8417:498-758(+)